MIHVGKDWRRAIAAVVLALAGLVAVSTPAGAQPSAERLMAAQQNIPCASLGVLRRELMSLSRASDPEVVTTLLDSVIRRMDVIVPRVPVIPGSTLKVLLNNFKAQRAELAASGLSPELLSRIRDTATTSYGLFAFVNCV